MSLSRPDEQPHGRWKKDGMDEKEKTQEKVAAALVASIRTHRAVRPRVQRDGLLALPREKVLRPHLGGALLEHLLLLFDAPPSLGCFVLGTFLETPNTEYS